MQPVQHRNTAGRRGHREKESETWQTPRQAHASRSRDETRAERVVEKRTPRRPAQALDLDIVDGVVLNLSLCLPSHPAKPPQCLPL